MNQLDNLKPWGDATSEVTVHEAGHALAGYRHQRRIAKIVANSHWTPLPPEEAAELDAKSLAGYVAYIPRKTRLLRGGFLNVVADANNLKGCKARRGRMANHIHQQPVVSGAGGQAGGVEAPTPTPSRPASTASRRPVRLRSDRLSRP